MQTFKPTVDRTQVDGCHEASAAWRPVLLLSAVVLLYWVVPYVLGRGPYGHGVFKLLSIYLGLFAVLGWVASLLIALSPTRLRRPLSVRLMAIGVALVVIVPLGDLACMLWSVRVGHLWYHSLNFSRAENTPDRELVWKRKPGLSWRGRKTPDCDEVAYRTDENGFRNPQGIGQADIVVVGDSVTEAGEVAEEATFVHKTGAALGFKAINLGTSGYGPQQELAALKRYGISYQPRLVIWQVTEWNDVQDAVMYEMRHEPSARALPPWEVLYARHSPVMQLTSALLPGKRPNCVAFQRSDGQVEPRAFWPYQPDLHKLLPPGFAGTKEAITAAFAMCQSRGVQFVVLYVPSHVRVLLPYMRFKNEAERDRFCPGGVADREDDLAHAMAEFCNRLGCPMIDMCPLLRRRAAIENRRIYVRNDPHLGIDGHDEVHLTLVRFVRAHLGPGDRDRPSETVMTPRPNVDGTAPASRLLR